MPIVLKRAYDKPAPEDGYRVLVDRIWPRGVTKDNVKLNRWIKEVAPSDALRKWFHKDPSRWGEFRRRYLSELKNNREELRRLAKLSKSERITLIFSASDKEHNNAVIVKQYLKMLGTR